MGKTLKYVKEFDFGPQKTFVKGYERGGQANMAGGKAYMAGGKACYAEGGKADIAQDKAMIKAAVHKHEKGMHPGKPMTKLAHGGKAMAAKGGKMSPAISAMARKEIMATPTMEKRESVQREAVRAPAGGLGMLRDASRLGIQGNKNPGVRRRMPVAPREPMIPAYKEGGPVKKAFGGVQRIQRLVQAGPAQPQQQPKQQSSLVRAPADGAFQRLIGAQLRPANPEEVRRMQSQPRLQQQSSLVRAPADGSFQRLIEAQLRSANPAEVRRMQSPFESPAVRSAVMEAQARMRQASPEEARRIQMQLESQLNQNSGGAPQMPQMPPPAQAQYKTGGKIATVMREFKEGKLHSGGSGKVVKSPKQAIAIALSESRAAKKRA